MIDRSVAAATCAALGASQQQFEACAVREVKLGSLAIMRALPVKGRRLIGPWCFLDRFGPLTFAQGAPMDVGPHPHTGLQTVTWLLDGEVVHDDSLKREALLRPGGVNVMTYVVVYNGPRIPAPEVGEAGAVQPGELTKSRALTGTVIVARRS